MYIHINTIYRVKAKNKENFVDFLKKTVHGVLCEIAYANHDFIYHFTDFRSAIKIMKDDEMFLSRTTPSSADFEISQKKLTFLSFTEDGYVEKIDNFSNRDFLMALGRSKERETVNSSLQLNREHYNRCESFMAFPS